MNKQREQEHDCHILQLNSQTTEAHGLENSAIVTGGV